MTTYWKHREMRFEREQEGIKKLTGIALAIISALFVIIVFQISFPSQAHAVSLEGYTRSGDSYDLKFQFSNNVGGQTVIEHNQALFHVYNLDDGGSPGFYIYCNFIGDTPGGSNSDLGGERRILHLVMPETIPGTRYQVDIDDGIRTQGGGTLSGGTFYFVTEGSRPAPEEPETPTEPDPVTPPPGDGGSSGIGGDDAIGGGNESGGSSSNGSVDEGGADVSGGTQNSGLNNVPISPSTSYSSEYSPAHESIQDVLQDVPVVSISDLATPEAAKSDLEGDNVSSRAAGVGGGTVYVIGQEGLQSGEKTDPQNDLSALLNLVLAVAAVLFIGAIGAFNRGYLWQKRTSTAVSVNNSGKKTFV